MVCPIPQSGHNKRGSAERERWMMMTDEVIFLLFQLLYLLLLMKHFVCQLFQHLLHAL